VPVLSAHFRSLYHVRNAQVEASSLTFI